MRPTNEPEGGRGGGLPVAALPAGCGDAKQSAAGWAKPTPRGKRSAQRRGWARAGRAGSLARGRAPRQRGIQRRARARRRSEVPLPATGRPIRSRSTMETANALALRLRLFSASAIANGILLLPSSSAARTGSSTDRAAVTALIWRTVSSAKSQSTRFKVARGHRTCRPGIPAYSLFNQVCVTDDLGKVSLGVHSPFPTDARCPPL
jgi:hypothetical protein